MGGLSECGKTTAGYRFQELGVRKSKIIHIEYDMMRERGINPDHGLTPDDFESLYKENPDEAFKEFLFRLIEKMKAENNPYASLESLYRAPLGEFIKKELRDKAVNIYIEAPVEDRAYREWVKVNAKATENGMPPIALETMIAQVNQKDQFKMDRQAMLVRDIADHVIDNSKSVSKDEFLARIDAVAASLGVTTP